MNIDPFLAWLEATALSQWVVGSPSIAFGFPGILVLHAIGMGLAAGLSVALDLRILGVARVVPLIQMRGYLPILWGGFWLNAGSGVLLLIGYPTKALTNPVFYLKLALIAIGMTILVHVSRRVAAAAESGEADETLAAALKWMAVVSIVCWAGAVTAGRLLAYTYLRLTVAE
jgi:hypothetical protein